MTPSRKMTLLDFFENETRVLANYIQNTIMESFGYAPLQNSVKNQFFPPGSVTGTSSRRLEYYFCILSSSDGYTGGT